jgi:crotonobetainyl-CoA:carnitine CoA-transferase CaiB-like acyl-CoA transferase
MTPLRGTLVVDASRMLPGAVLARQLLELGARLIKIEDPAGGDPLRGAPPVVDGIGAGFEEFLRGAESLCLDLRVPRDAARLRKLARGADVLVESFRPGSMKAWDIGPDRFIASNPSLVLCMLSGFGSRGSSAARVGHDVNFVAVSGLLDLLPGPDVPRVQIADINAGLLACSAILAALLARARSGRGAIIDQPLTSGTMPLIAWPLADASAGGGGLTDPGSLLTGGCPAYGVYSCKDSSRLAVGALEPKFWVELTKMLDLSDLDDTGLDTGEQGREAARQVGERFATREREHWLTESARRGLPVTAVHPLEDAAQEAALVDAGLIVDGRCDAFMPSVGHRPVAPAPGLGQHTSNLVREFGLDAD